MSLAARCELVLGGMHYGGCAARFFFYKVRDLSGFFKHLVLNVFGKTMMKNDCSKKIWGFHAENIDIETNWLRDYHLLFFLWKKRRRSETEFLLKIPFNFFYFSVLESRNFIAISVHNQHLVDVFLNSTYLIIVFENNSKRLVFSKNFWVFEFYSNSQFCL